MQYIVHNIMCLCVYNILLSKIYANNPADEPNALKRECAFFFIEPRPTTTWRRPVRLFLLSAGPIFFSLLKTCFCLRGSHTSTLTTLHTNRHYTHAIHSIRSHYHTHTNTRSRVAVLKFSWPSCIAFRMTDHSRYSGTRTLCTIRIYVVYYRSKLFIITHSMCIYACIILVHDPGNVRPRFINKRVNRIYMCSP